jgi:hypothetical protein
MISRCIGCRERIVYVTFYIRAARMFVFHFTPTGKVGKETLMPRRKDRPHGAPAPVLTAPTLSAIHDLNNDYLDLLIADREAQHVAKPLPAAVVAGLADLDSSARRAIAACPFALYSLGIDHQDFWRIAAGPRHVAEEAVRYRPLMSLSAASSFGIGALFFAWHVASTQRMAARVCFAIPDFVIDGLAGLRLWDLQRIARERPALMRPRWPAHAGFWPDLIRFAARGDIDRLNTTQLLGSHLIAGELRGHAAPRSPMRIAMTSPANGSGPSDLVPVF